MNSKDSETLASPASLKSRSFPRVGWRIPFLLVFGLAVGLFFARDYGLSWDEYLHRVYARDTIEMYQGHRAPGDTVTDLRFYGPAFSVAWLLAANTLTTISPRLSPSDAGHIIYWLAFIPAPALVYALARRVASRNAALGASLLFASQPLIFGHAFVNPKDTPFMTAFLASVWVGLRASDMHMDAALNLSPRRLLLEANGVAGRVAIGWKSASTVTKTLLALLWCASLGAAIWFHASQIGLREVEGMIRLAYDGRSSWPVQSLFNWAASDAWKTPLEAYLEKARAVYSWAEALLYVSVAAFVLLLSSRHLRSRTSGGPIGGGRPLLTWAVAAVALGLCSAIRVFGLYAGVLVSFHAILTARRRALLPLGVYWLLAMLTLYAAWPFLWRSPIMHFAEAVFRMSRFPWEGRVLYEGSAYSVIELPWQYVPITILLRLTIPAMLLGALGILRAFMRIGRSPREASFLILAVGWLLVPLVLVVALDVHIYSAFRQVMFVFPALFILAALAFDLIFGVLKGPVWAALILGVAIAPGLLAIARLHPYEMIYYNEIIGGVPGANGRFGLDSWGTEYREAAEFINQVAPDGALVLVGSREHHTMTPFAREDLRLATLRTEGSCPPPGSFILVGGGSFPTGEVLYTISRAGVPLASVVEIPAESICPPSP